MTENAQNHLPIQKDLHVVVLGLNHLTASVDYRDKAHFSRDEILAVTDLILREPDFHEVVVLSTCNRSEIYAATSRFNERETLLEKAWAQVKSLEESELRGQTYYCRDSEAVSHLFRVISSLDSMIMGENQILGQVKDAYDLACKNNSVDFYFNFLFQNSFKVGKRVRSETTLNEGAVSISSAAVDLAQKVLGQNFGGRVVGIVGSGEMGELTAFHLNKAGASQFIFFNRSLNNAEKLAARFGGDIYTLSHLKDKLSLCDIVVSSTGARDAVILKGQVESAVKARNGKPIFFIDIAAPRDIEESVQEIPGTFVFTIDDLKNIVGKNKLLRQEAADATLQIIKEEVAKVEFWYANLDLVTVIRQLRSKFEGVVREELDKKRKNQPSEVLEELEKFSQGLVGKLLHIPIAGLKKMGENGSAKKASHFANQIFSLMD
ncbi:glutamyl-tRNA reductase [Fibrobacterota bacterium]